MLSTLQKRINREEDGFTLIELMVVVLIIAILIAIAIPTFLGAQDRARDRGAQSDLRNALTAAKTVATDNAGLFDQLEVADLAAAEGSLDFAADGAAGTAALIGVEGASTTLAPSANYILLYKQSASGEWFGVATSSTGEVGYCRGNAVASVNTAGVDAALALTGCNGNGW